MPADRIDRALLLLLLALNALIKFSWLGVNELSGDEPFTVYWSQRSLHDLSIMLKEENNPPLYFLIMKAWSAITPFEREWLRVPSALFSTLAAWPLFLLARRIGTRSIAIGTVLLFTLTNYHYGFAHEVRAYSLFTLLAIGSMWSLARMNGGAASSSGRILVLAGVNTLMVYAHFLGWLMIGIQLLSVLILSEWRPCRRNFLIASCITLLCYLPYASIFAGRLGQSVTQGTWLEAPAWEEPYNMIWRWSNQPVIAVCLLAAIAFALWRTRARDLAMRIGLIWAFVPLLGMYLVSFAVPIYLDRYLVWAAPGFALLVAAALFRLAMDVRVGHFATGLACTGMLFTFMPWKDNGRHPSAVWRQWEEWGGSSKGLTWVLPYWYDLTLVASSELEALKGDAAYPGDYLARVGIHSIEGQAMEGDMPDSTDEQVLVINAGADVVDPDRSWYRTLSVSHPAVDSLEADHRVWVYRFRR